MATLVCFIAYSTVSYLIATEVTKAERKPQEDHPAYYDLSFEEVEFKSRHGDVVLKGWHIHAAKDGPTLIFVHGLNSIRSGDGAIDIAYRMSLRGFSALLFDLRAHGSSGGDRVSAGQYEIDDVLGAFDYLIQRGVAHDRIGLIGFSFGAGVAIMAASRERSIRAVVADSPFASVSDLLSQETARKMPLSADVSSMFLPGAKIMAERLYGIRVQDLAPEKDVYGLEYPILVIHGMADTRIGYAHGQRVTDAAAVEGEIWLVPEVGHVDAFNAHPGEYIHRLADYFSAQLNHKPL